MTLHRPHILRASTLAELLVMMIIAGIVFLSVAEGIGQIKRFTISLTNRITGSTCFYNSYYRLESLITTADSITLDDGGILQIHSTGIRTLLLQHCDSTLIVWLESNPDTLFSNLSEFSPVPNLFHRYMVDTVSMTFFGEPLLKINFATMPRKEENLRIRLDSIENKYAYE